VTAAAFMLFLSGCLFASAWQAAEDRTWGFCLFLNLLASVHGYFGLLKMGLL
jgi:hypothetical protein